MGASVNRASFDSEMGTLQAKERLRLKELGQPVRRRSIEDPRKSQPQEHVSVRRAMEMGTSASGYKFPKL